MEPHLIIHECNRRGASLSADGDTIRIKGPRGAIGEGLKGLIRDQKSELLAYLDRLDGENVESTRPDSTETEAIRPATRPPFSESGLVDQVGINPEKPKDSDYSLSLNPSIRPTRPPLEGRAPIAGEKNKTGNMINRVDPGSSTTDSFYSSELASLPQDGGLVGLVRSQVFGIEGLSARPSVEKSGLATGLVPEIRSSAASVWEFDPAEFHDRLFARRVAIWTTADGRLEWHDTDGTLTAVERSILIRHPAELVDWLTTPQIRPEPTS